MSKFGEKQQLRKGLKELGMSASVLRERRISGETVLETVKVEDGASEAAGK